MTSRIDTAMVLAAGLGTRMAPASGVLPKPLVQLDGKTLLDRVLDRLAAAGIGRAVVNVHHKADQIEVFDLPKSVVEPLERLLEQAGSFEITRNEGQLYITHGREHLEGPVLKTGLSETS